MKGKGWGGAGIGISLFFLASGGTSFGAEKGIQKLVSEGNAFYLKGDFQKALENYQKALLFSADPVTKAKIHYNLGNTHFRLGELPEALLAYQEALRLHPEDKDAKHNLEVVLRALEGENLILGGGSSEIEEPPKEETLDETLRVLLKALEEADSRDPRGLPVPPSPAEGSKSPQKDW